MTRAIFEAQSKDDLKHFVALARKQGIAVKYLRISLRENPKDIAWKKGEAAIKRIQKQSLARGLDKMSDIEIAREIAAAKKESRAKIL